LFEKINLVLSNINIDIKKNYNIVFSDIKLDVNMFSKIFLEMFWKTSASTSRSFCDINFEINIYCTQYATYYTSYTIHHTLYIIFGIYFSWLESHLLCVFWHEKTNYLYKWNSGREDKPYGICEFSKFYKVVEVDIKKKDLDIWVDVSVDISIDVSIDV